MPDLHNSELADDSSPSSISGSSSTTTLASNGAASDGTRLDALRSQRRPNATILQSGHETQAVIHGIWHNLSFDQSLEGVEACQQPKNTALARARHARLIMSNVVTQDTYRQVARRYPHLTYNVARACAVAGYADLYKELDVLPKVAVAEEAQALENGTEIFKYIMA